MKTSTTRKAIYLIVVVLLTALLVRVFLIDSFVVIGDSMAPTMTSGDYIFVNKTAYWFSQPARGDIVVGNFRVMTEKKVIKRVLGLPGEWIFIENGNIYVSTERTGSKTEVGKLDKESFTDEITSSYSYRLDPYEYFLLGDNGLNSVDSRELGPVDIYAIDGRVAFKLRF